MRDAIEVDRARPNPQGVAALRSKRSNGDVDDRGRDRDLRVLETHGASEREDPFLEIGGRIPGLVTCPREPKQELRVLRRLGLAHAAGRTRFHAASRTTARRVIPTIAANVSGALRSVSTAKKSKDDCGRGNRRQHHYGERSGVRSSPIAGDTDEQKDQQRAGAADGRDRREVDEIGDDKHDRRRDQHSSVGPERRAAPEEGGELPDLCEHAR